MILLFLTSGLLIGFTLGFQDVYLLLGARLRNSGSILLLAFFVSFALILGVLTNMDGSSAFVGELVKTKQIQIAFLILASALITTTVLRLKFRIISISHAVIGSVTGWLLFVENSFPLDKILVIIIIWLLTPILAGFLSASYLTLLKYWMRKTRVHILIISRVLQILLVGILLIGAYSIGANNIANVVGAYVPVFDESTIQILDFNLSGKMVLAILGSFSISLGLLTRAILKSKKQDIEIFEFSPETNFSVLLAFTTIFFLFSSTFFQSIINVVGLSYPLVPISALHILTAGVVGVSYKKGFNIYNKDAFVGLAIGSILTPVFSGLIMFISALGLKSLWSKMESTPNSIIGSNAVESSNTLRQVLTINDSSIIYNTGVIVLLSAVLILGIFIYTRMQRKFNLEREKFLNNKSELENEKEFFKKELAYSSEQAENLKQEIDFKNKELEKFAFNLVEKEEILKKVKDILALVKKSDSEKAKKQIVSELSSLMLNNLNLSNDKISFYQKVDDINKDFYIRLS